MNHLIVAAFLFSQVDITKIKNYKLNLNKKRKNHKNKSQKARLIPNVPNFKINLITAKEYWQRLTSAKLMVSEFKIP